MKQYGSCFLILLCALISPSVNGAKPAETSLAKLDETILSLITNADRKKLALDEVRRYKSHALALKNEYTTSAGLAKTALAAAMEQVNNDPTYGIRPEAQTAALKKLKRAYMESCAQALSQYEEANLALLEEHNQRMLILCKKELLVSTVAQRIFATTVLLFIVTVISVAICTPSRPAR